MKLARWTGGLLLAWERAHSSLWFVPSLLVLVAVALSAVLLEVDANLEAQYASDTDWLFSGNAQGARTVLSVIASSLITVVAVAFSVTMIAIQQASTQFTPRVLRNFTRDRGNQIVLGTYIGTFTYALLVLRRVREAGPEGEAFVPSISISTGMALSLVSLAMLVYFIHHVSETLQVSYLLTAVRRDLDHEIEHLFPETIDADGSGDDDEAEVDCERAAGAAGGTGTGDAEPHAGRPMLVCSRREGYLRHVDAAHLASVSELGVRHVHVEARIGDYLRPGDVVIRAWPDEDRDDEADRRLADALQVDRDRSHPQDPLFGMRQLVDIGVKALSPGINDPTTAEQALDHLGGAMALLLGRAIPSAYREVDGVGIRFRTPAFADYVEESFAQVRRSARSELRVSLYLAGILRSLLDRTSSGSRARAIRHQLDEVLAGFDVGTLSDAERERLERAVRG